MKSVLQNLAEKLRDAHKSRHKPSGNETPGTLASLPAASRPHSETDDSDPRYDACMLLADHGIPCTIFGEDALFRHGVATAVFDLYLVVADTRLAGECLLEAAFRKKPQPSQLIRILEFDERYVFGPETEEPAGIEEIGVVLLSAHEWHYRLPDSMEGLQDWFPPLPDLLDSLVARWTDDTTPELRGKLAVLIDYCYLYIQGVKANKYTMNLSKENRQLHYDLVAETASAVLGTARCQEHYRMVRGQIRRGQHEPTGPSGVQLFPKQKPKWPVSMPIAGA